MPSPAFPVRRGRAPAPPACRCRGSSCRRAPRPGPGRRAAGSRSKPMSRGQRLGDLVEHRRVEGVHARRWRGRSRGCAGFSTKPTTRPSATSTMPHSDGSGRVEDGQRGDRAAGAVSVDEHPQVEVGEVVRVDRRGTCPRPRRSRRLASRVPALPSSTGSWLSRTTGGADRAPATCASTRPARWWVLTQHLVDAGLRRARPARCRASAGHRPRPGTWGRRR